MLASETTIQQRHRNPGASFDLVIPIHVTLNVPEEIIFANVHANSRLNKEWLRTKPAHHRIAVMCGSGPSLADKLHMVRFYPRERSDIFAMNGAAAFLDRNGILPDFQVLADARERTAELIGPAKAHLFASQVHPKCFEIVPDAQLWHFDNGEMESQLPPYQSSYALIGGAGSVGNCALALAWAMGYRRFEIYGYDSSHRSGEGHAFHQPINDSEPYGTFEFKGRQYQCSYTMRSQANMFMLIGRELLRQGCVVNVHGDGILPDMWRENVRISQTGTLEEKEQHKYELMWSVPEYRDMSPAEGHYDAIKEFLRDAKPADRVVDYGCGTGRVLARIRNELGCDVLGIDFVQALEIDVPFIKSNLWEDGLYKHRGDYGICCDVMEHIPPEQVDDVLDNISACIKGPVFFSISSNEDDFGRQIGEHLHVSLHPPDWWEAKLREFWTTVRPLPGGVFICEP